MQIGIKVMQIRTERKTIKIIIFIKLVDELKYN